MKSLRTLKVKAFTLIEMLVVLLIISVLLLLFVPNLTKQKDSVTDTGNRAVVKVVESQAELYELNHQNEKASLSKLVAEGQITQKQAEGELSPLLQYSSFVSPDRPVQIPRKTMFLPPAQRLDGLTQLAANIED